MTEAEAHQEQDTEDNGTYYVAVNDMFAVPDDQVDSKAEAERYVLKKFGEEGWLPHDVEVVDYDSP